MYSDILKVTSCGRAQIESLRSVIFGHFQFQLGHQRSLFELRRLLKTVFVRFLKDGILTELVY